MSLCELVERQLLKSTRRQKIFIISYDRGLPPFLGESNGEHSNRHLAKNFSARYGSKRKIRCCSGDRLRLSAEWGQIVAILIRLVGDFDVAEEAAQEAFTSAVNQWQSTGIPDLLRA